MSAALLIARATLGIVDRLDVAERRERNLAEIERAGRRARRAAEAVKPSLRGRTLASVTSVPQQP
ncbi:MAG: hypothetical protein ACOYNR_16550 [Blastocatellia bacterium]